MKMKRVINTIEAHQDMIRVTQVTTVATDDGEGILIQRSRKTEVVILNYSDVKRIIKIHDNRVKADIYHDE